MGEGLAYLAALFGPRDRAALERRQQRLLRALEARFGDYPALASYRRFADLPVIDIAAFRADFEGYNSANLTRTQAESAAMAVERIPTLAPSYRGEGPDEGLTRSATNAECAVLPSNLRAGFSTGTSGATRGLFVTSAEERAAYTGQILARLLTPFDFRLKRIALCLRAPNDLYRAGPFDLRFFPLSAESAEAIADFNPDLLIAPSQVLLALASRDKRPRLKRLYYGAETLNATERDYITQRLGVRPDPIYQATEGFLGAPCRLGTLHLNEDSLIIERENLGSGRFRPIVTDLKRRTQAIVRLRLDDILEAATCTCGSPLAAVKPVEGRVQDIWRWPGQTVFPREVDEAVAPNLPAPHPWIATGHPGGIRYACRDADAPAVAAALAKFGRKLTRETYNLTMDFPKRRHVRWAP